MGKSSEIVGTPTDYDWSAPYGLTVGKAEIPSFKVVVVVDDDAKEGYVAEGGVEYEGIVVTHPEAGVISMPLTVEP